ncbi:PREDICTED: uncharacterized protein LOC104701058 [Camelina sativa]|uniref:Uncharacterized protein LOC104701058 n=1 Tax=Camelina sativa TaxID=90675 RepID=A0ABM0SRA4_CAMSA|nr:PREDICTED: uncharacterized protein LOC104701058 [Camelina sativa]
MANTNTILEVEAYDPDMEPPQNTEGKCKMAKKFPIFELKSGLSDMLRLTSRKQKKRFKELKKKLIQYIKENNMPIETRELEIIEEPHLLCEIIILLKELIIMDL